jgi:ABC-type multidrug transport system ATPase subunit
MRDIAIRTEDLSKTFGSTEALADLNLDVPVGEVLGYLVACQL